MSSASCHLMLMVPRPSLHDVDDHVALHDRLAAEPRVEGQPRRGVQAILLVRLHRGQVLLSLADDHVAGRARTAAAAVVLHPDPVMKPDTEPGGGVTVGAAA